MRQPEQSVHEQDRETRAEAFLDGEKTGLLFRMGALTLDKLYLHSPLTSIDHITVFQQATPSRVFLGTIAALSARNLYRRFKHDSGVDDIEAFEREIELEELREIAEANASSNPNPQYKHE